MFEPVSGSAELFKQSFREEAREILADLESALLELNEKRGDAELVSRIFRGLHTIKGSGAMFGFERMAAFTHDLETAFDLVRNGRMQTSSDLIDLTLAALDQIKTMLAESPDAGLVSEASLCDDILQRLRKFAAIDEIAAPAPESPSPRKISSLPAGGTQIWRIRFAPGADLMLCGASPSLLLRELGQLGSLSVKADLDAIPPLAELDPERCYIAWEMTLRTVAPIESIRDVFIFVENCSSLQIEPGSRADAVDTDLTARGVGEQRESGGGRRDYDFGEKASSIRVAAAKLDSFVNLVGELVTVQAWLSELAARRDDADLSAASEEIERLASALRENSMDMRMMQVRGTFEKFRRLVHDLARSLDKNVELTIEGAETELDKSVIDQLSDPLMHLIRNSMDHGIGTSEERIARGKPARATIHLAARYAGATVQISVSDDGRGIDAEAVRAKAIERGMIGPDASLSESEVYALIFQPGFSTAKQVTDISGRGVGMDVVRRNIDKLRGSIDVMSKPGEGTTVTLRLPLTLAIIDGLLVAVGKAFFVLPLTSVLECIELPRKEIDAAHGKRLISVRGETVPYIRLRDHFQVVDNLPDFERVILVDTEDGCYGLMVDAVLGNCQTMIKSLGRVYRHLQTISGATILGNGTIALILDPLRLVEECLRTVRPAVRGHPGISLKAGHIKPSA